MSDNSGSASPTRVFVLIILSAIIFGFGGYWYGSRNPGGFAVGPGPVNDILKIDQGPARNAPGSVTMVPAAGLKEYKNDYIGLSFMFPNDYVVEDKWMGDSTDLMIMMDSIQRKAGLLSGEITGDEAQYSQLEIDFFQNIEQMDYFNLGIKNLDQFALEYSKESVDPLGATNPPQFSNTVPFANPNLSGYVAENSELNGNGKIYLFKGSKGFFQIIFRDDKGLTEDIQNTILSNLEIS